MYLDVYEYMGVNSVLKQNPPYLLQLWAIPLERTTTVSLA
jgi:hypothetical protein